MPVRKPHVYATEAFVLKRIDFGEADRILTLLTPHGGKMRAIAKGVRRTTSRLAGHLELFTCSSLLLARGRELDIITQSETRERFAHLSEELWHGAHAFYAAELVDRFLEDAGEHEGVYHLLLDTFRRLDRDAATAGAGQPTAGNVALALRYFEIHLLGQLGYRPAFHRCANCGKSLEPIENGFNPALGGVVCPACSRYAHRTLSLPALKVLRLLQTMEWDALPRLRLGADVQDEVEQVLHLLIRYHLERDLKSLDFLQALRVRG
jgi:DNA repair protein RecO (recombination protein O)